MVHFKRLLFAITSFHLIRTISEENCDGCADDKQSCHIFKSGSNKYVGCYGEFYNGTNGIQDLCSPPWIAMNVSQAVDEGFTVTMCESVSNDEIFFFNEGGTFFGINCNSDLTPDNWNTVGLWGCTGDADDDTLQTFGDACSISVNGLTACLDITAFLCRGTTNLIIDGSLIIDVGTENDEFNTLDFLNSSYGGAICIREPS